ncbi:hypothetical protein HMPREF0348_1082, partial [Enterococcus faecalis TX0104]
MFQRAYCSGDSLVISSFILSQNTSFCEPCYVSRETLVKIK